MKNSVMLLSLQLKYLFKRSITTALTWAKSIIVPIFDSLSALVLLTAFFKFTKHAMSSPMVVAVRDGNG